MWKNFRKKISKLPWWMTNPFFISMALFATWMMFFDESNLITQYHKHRELSDLLQKKKYYRDQIKETNRAFSELTTNPATQEKFAREHYWMKRDNEDVFVIVEEPAKTAN
jgi:cell division protein DivIC